MSLASIARKTESPSSSRQSKAPAQGLRVSRPEDALEQEADRVAKAVMRGGSPGAKWQISTLNADGVQRQTPPPPAGGGAQQPAVSQQSTDPMAILGKLAEAFIQTDVGKKLKDAVANDELVKGATGFVNTLPGKVVAGAAAVGTVSALAAAKQPLPMQIPSIPLDALKPGLSVKIDYQGPVNHPTQATITFSFTPKGDTKKPASAAGAGSQGPGSAPWDPTRNMKYKPGSPQDLEQQQQDKLFEQYQMKRLMQLPGMPGGSAGIPATPSSGQNAPGSGLKMPELQNPFAAKAPSLLDQKLELKSLSSQPDAEKKKEEPAAVQRKAESGAGEGAVLTAEALPRSAGRPLERQTRAFMESRFGFDFSKVRVHADGEAASSARRMNAVAYTVGNDIVFGAGQYSPETTEGRQLLAHELVHTVQQSGDRTRAAQASQPSSPVPVQRKCACSDPGGCGACSEQNDEIAPLDIQRGEQPEIQRTCISGVPCPAAALELPAGWPWSEAAEICIRTDYIRNHGTNFIGSNNTWQFMNIPPTTPAGRDHSCFKSSLMAKSGMFLAQPDIIDFTSAEIYDVTTMSQAVSHHARLDADTNQATALAASVGCGSSATPPTMRQWSVGSWAPLSCYSIGNDIYLRVENDRGLLIYHVLKDVKKELVTVTLMATLAALMKAGKGAGGKAAGRALAYANIAAIVILLASNKAEAKTGPGDEMPIETLFKAMAQKGTPVPPELQESMKSFLEQNPDLKKKVDDAATKGGDMTDVQKELSNRALKIVTEHPEEFSTEDLELMLQANEAAGPSLPASDITASKLRAALDAKKRGETASGQSKEGSGSGSGSDKPAGDKPATDKPDAGKPGTDKPAGGGKPNVWEKAKVDSDPKLKGLSQPTRDKIAAAPENVRSLFMSITQAGGSGAPVTDAVVDRYLSLVPADITIEQVQGLISKMSDSQSTDADQILDSLQKALADTKQKEAKEDSAAAEWDVASIEPTKPSDGGQTPDDTAKKLQELAQKGDFSNVAAGTILLTWSWPNDKADQINATLKTVTAQGVKAAGRVTGKITERQGQKLKIKIVSATPIVTQDGALLRSGSDIVGRTQEYTLVSKGSKKQ